MTPQVLTGCGKVLTAVLGPLVACVFFTARMSAGAAARIGTMRRTNQTHALELLGVRPADWLLTPLVWSMAIAMPIAVLCADVVGALASFASARLVAGTTAIGWAEAFFRAVDRADLRSVIAKGVLSGVLVAILTYHLAMMPKRSGKDVGDSVNASIVLGLCAVLAVHSVLTVVRFG
jgi:phospholipid/cholesterol/gamma-HCH transport system permease protein